VSSIPELLTLPYAVFVAGTVAIISSSLRVAAGVASLRWSGTPGRVLARDVDDSAGKYQPVLEYSYEVNGVQYRGHRISFDFDLRRRSSSTALLLFHKYRPGQEITVFFDPQRPYRSVIERGVSTSLVLGLVGGIGLVAYVLTVF
jgi:Protein of unknown function (DUF3592)